MSYDHQSPSDRADQEPDAYDGRDWDARLHKDEPPKDREVWLVVDDFRTDTVFAVQARWDDLTFHYMRENVWARTDGEAGDWSHALDEILGWTDSYEDAVQAAREFAEFVA